MSKPKFAPKEIFDETLKWFVMPTFDLILEYQNKIILVKRRIAPYKNQWALPGLRMYKGEEITDTLNRIAKQEVGIDIDPENAVLIGQYVGKFKTENQRQDISTCYAIKIPQNKKIKINTDHFSEYQVTNKIPTPIGAMYKYYLHKYWTRKNAK